MAVVPARPADSGHRDISRPMWVRVVIADDGAGLTAAHLAAAQLVGCHGMVTEVLYRE